MSVPKCCDALGIVSADEVVPLNWTTTWDAIRTEMVTATTGNEIERAALTVSIFQLLSEVKDTECQGWLINKVVKQIPAGAHALRTDILSLLPKHLLICYLDVKWALEGNAGTAGQWLDDIIRRNPHGVDNAGFVCHLIVDQPMRGWPANSKNQLTTKIQRANAIYNSMNEWKDCARVASHCLCNGFEGSRNQVLELVNLRNQEVGNRKAVKWMMCLPDVRDCYKALLGLDPFVAAPAPAVGGPPMTPVTPRRRTAALAGVETAIRGPIAGKTYRFLQIADDFVERRREFHGREDVLGNLSREEMFGTGDNPYFHPNVVLGEEVHMLKWRLSLTSIVEANSHLTPVMPLTYEIGGHAHRLQEFVLGPTVSRHFPNEDDALLAANLVYILSYGQINGFHDTYGGEAAYKAFLKAGFFLACWKYAKNDVSAIPPSKQTYVQLELLSVEKQRFDAFQGYVLQHHGCHLDREESSQFKTFAGDNTAFVSKLGSLKSKMSLLVVSSSYQPTATGPNSTKNLMKGLYFEQWMSLFSLMGDGTDADSKTVTLPVISNWKIGGNRDTQRDATFYLQSLEDDDRPELWRASYKMGLLGLSAGGVNDIQQSQAILDRIYSPDGVPTAVKLAMFTADPPAIHVLPGTGETPGTKNMITPFESTPRVGFGSTPSCKRALDYSHS